MTSGTRIETAAILATARQARSEANAADTRVLVAAVEWARLHETTDTELAATWGDTPVLIAGPGTPLVAKFAISEFASVVGMSSEGGKGLIAEAMELAHRLPLTWSRVLRGRLAAWRARRIAAATMELSIEAAAYVDQQVVSFAHRVGPAEMQRLVNAAIVQFMPEFAAERAADAAEGRFFTVDHRQISFAGTSQVYGELDLADAIDLDRAVQHGADQLADLGSTDSVNVRRAIAVGHLARGDVSLGFPGAKTPAEARQARRPMRDLVLYLT